MKNKSLTEYRTFLSAKDKLEKDIYANCVSYFPLNFSSAPKDLFARRLDSYARLT